MKNKKIIKPDDAVEIAISLLQDKFKEHFIGLYLNARNQTTKAEVIGIGILDACIVHPREVYRPAVVSHSAGVIILHNHPSNNVEPSPADNEITKRIKKAGEILGIELLDHIIFTDKKKFYSYKDNNLI